MFFSFVIFVSVFNVCMTAENSGKYFTYKKSFKHLYYVPYYKLMKNSYIFRPEEVCQNSYVNCEKYTKINPNYCKDTSFFRYNCRKSCNFCGKGKINFLKIFQVRHLSIR